MVSTLAQQLNALKIQQRDALSVPQRTRISFLFDSKQAANIDDQTLYYICKTGIKQLKDQGTIDLSAFEGDILNENSLSFYRGTETKDTNSIIDEQLDALLKALSPWLLEQAALKIIEYLIRVYEVHIYQKQTLLFAFIPLFETVYFLRISQCLNLKDDQVWGWLNEFSYQGQSIDKQTLIKCISRNNGLVFCLCAKYCLEVKGELHTKWFGAFLSDVIKQNSNEGLMFNVLPHISQALKQQESRDMRIACFLALGQLACRRNLTSEYTQAFVRQLLLSIGSQDQLEFDEDLKLKGLTTIIFFTQYQKVVFDKKTLSLLLKIPKLHKYLEQISKNFDTSSLCQFILDGCFQNQVNITTEELKYIIKPLLNLKSVFLAVQNLLTQSELNEISLVKIRSQLDILKELQADNFKQSTIFVLKQTSEAQQRDKMIKILQDNSIKSFGENKNEFSIISALSSKIKATREQALSTLNDDSYMKSLNENEKALIHMILLQILDQEGHEQLIFMTILSTLNRVQILATDVDFDCLLKLLDRIALGKLNYNQGTIDYILTIMCQIKVQRSSNTKIQAWLAYQSQTQLQNQNPFTEFVDKKLQKAKNEEVFAQKFMEMPQPAISLLLCIFQEKNAFFDYQLIAKLLKKIGQTSSKDLIHSIVVEQLFMPILSIMKLNVFNASNEILNVISDSGLQQDQKLNNKLVKKILGVSLVQKQWNPQNFDLVTLHKKLSSDKQKFAELMIDLAVTSSCQIKRIFACQVLCAFHQKGKLQFQIQSQISCKIIIGVVLILLNDSDRYIREQALLLASEVLQMQSKVSKEQNIEVIEVFFDTEKPQSAQKKPIKLTPMKSKSVSALLQDIIDAKSDLLLDRSQLKQVLSKHSKPEIFEEILRTLLDYPTFALKQKLLDVLTLPQKHAMIFCMNLAQVLQKIFIQIDKSTNIVKDCEGYITSLANLINHLQEYSNKTVHKEILTSLTLPFLKQIVEKKVLTNLVHKIFDNSVLISELLKEVDQRVLKEIFKTYIKAAQNSQKLRQLFVSRMQGVYKGEDLAFCLVGISEQTNLELTLETVIQLTSTPSIKLFEQSLQLLDQQVNKFIKNEEVAYVIDLCCQIAINMIPSKLDKSTQILQQIVESISKVWNRTKQIVQNGINQVVEKPENPFDEFMKEDQADESSQDEEEVDLLQSLQVTSSIINLQTQLEHKESLGYIPQTTELLSNIADYLLIIYQQKSDAVSSSTQIKSQLFHMYQSLLLKTTQKQFNSIGTQLPYSKVIIKYVQTCIKLINGGFMSKQLIEGNLVLSTFKTIPKYASLICYTLLWEASNSQIQLHDSNQIKFDAENSASLFLLHQVLLWQLDLEQNLSVFQDLMYLLHNVSINETSRQLIENQTEILFPNFQSFHLQESLLIISQADSKSRRKFIYLSNAIFSQWFMKDSQMLHRLSLIAGIETPSQIVQTQLLDIILSSYIIREQISHLLQSDSSISLVRLQTAVNNQQHVLNQMMSLQIHVQLVIKLLDMKPLALKINTLCLLLDKFSTFSTGWLSKCTSDLHKIIQLLIKKCILMLKENQTESLSQLLLTVLSRTASVSLPKEIQVETLEITMQHHKGSLQLQTQTILTEMILMETYTFSVLDYFHLYLQHTLSGFETNDTQFVDTYKHALLKSLVCICSIFLKFLSADQLEQVITHCLAAAAQGVIIAKEGDTIEVIFESIASESVNHKKLVLQATMNTYSLLAKCNDSKKLIIMQQRYFSQLLAPVIRRLPQSFITEHHQKFIVFFKQIFTLPLKSQASTTLIVECFNAFILKINEETLRPILVTMTKWSGKIQQRKSIYFQILCGCLNTLREFFVPMISIYFEQVQTTLVECFESLNQTNKLQKRSHSTAITNEDSSFELLVVVCNLIELNYKYDTSSCIQNDSFETLCDPISNLFDLINIPNFDSFVNSSLKPMILEMDERTQDESMWQKLNYSLLMKTRSENWQTRLAVLSVIDYLFDKMRERYLVILNDTIPFVSELLEDENEKVELAAKTIVNRIEQLTGESINEYLK